MLTYEQAQEALTEIADNLPLIIYEGLNGGIILSPDLMKHPEDVDGSLYILGQYRQEPRGLGNYIVIYYGSFRRVHGRLPERQQLQKLEDVLLHELTHHLEHKAGDRSLDIKDAIDLAKYKRRFRD